MGYKANPIISEFSSISIDSEKTGVTFLYENSRIDRSPMYLRSWGNDYPYLDEYKNCVQGCLPIPENSKAQRLIRRLNVKTSLK